MNKHLFRQIFNQWRSNIWLVVELLIVSVVLWYITDSLYVTYKRVNLPFVHDTEHCYLIEFDGIDSTSPYYKPGAHSDQIRNISTLLDHIKHRKEVEAACMVYRGMYPFSFYSTYNGVGYKNDNDSLVFGSTIYSQYCTSQYPLVFRIHGANGETPEEVAAALKENKLLMSANAFSDEKVKAEQFLNKPVYHNGEWLTLGVVIPQLRIHTYDNQQEWMVRNASIAPYEGGDIAFRVRADMDKDIIPSLLEDVNKYVSGDKIISSVKSFKDIKRNAELDYTNESRNFIVVALFLMVNIFLGLLGTFWFRTQQRTSEIAVRRAVGSTDRQILGRIISEGLILLTVATVPAIVIDLTIAHFQLTKSFFEFIGWERTGFCILATYVVMSLMIVLGAMAPALRAMHINPAIALKDE